MMLVDYFDFWRWGEKRGIHAPPGNWSPTYGGIFDLAEAELWRTASWVSPGGNRVGEGYSTLYNDGWPTDVGDEGLRLRLWYAGHSRDLGLAEDPTAEEATTYRKWVPYYGRNSRPW